jgi:hypothetical protein
MPFFAVFPSFWTWRSSGKKFILNLRDTRRYARARLPDFDKRYHWFHSEKKIKWTAVISFLVQYPSRIPEAYEFEELKLLQFPVNSPFEIGFWRLADMKTKYRKGLDDTKSELCTINQNFQKIHSSQGKWEMTYTCFL